jgi:hypothetical protein
VTKLHALLLEPVLPMSKRARIYLLIAATRHVSLGIAALVSPDLFSGPAYSGIRDAMPGRPSSDIMRWGILFLCTGLLCTWAGIRGQDGLARWALLASVCTTALLAGGFIAVSLHGVNAPTGLVGYLALLGKDLVQIRQPMRTPFEDVVRRVLARRSVQA